MNTASCKRSNWLYKIIRAADAFLRRCTIHHSIRGGWLIANLWQFLRAFILCSFDEQKRIIKFTWQANMQCVAILAIMMIFDTFELVQNSSHSDCKTFRTMAAVAASRNEWHCPLCGCRVRNSFGDEQFRCYVVLTEEQSRQVNGATFCCTDCHLTFWKG